MRQEVKAFCSQCVSRCGCKYITEDGHFVSVDTNPTHPTGKHLCIKGKAGPEIVYSQDRLLYPMKRTRPKGDSNPGWEKISWDEALELITLNLKTIAANYGAESLAYTVTTRSGTSIQDSFSWILRLAYAYGTPNVVLATENCNWHKDFATSFTFGAGIGMPEFEKTKCLLLWGFNPVNSWLAFETEVAMAKKNGAKIIVIDPRKAGNAGTADEWLRLIPGTDGALALGLANEIIRNNYYDHDFILNWTNGPFLVRNDNGHFLTEADIVDGGLHSRFVAWDEEENQPIIFDPLLNNFITPPKRLALSGEYKNCTPAFSLYKDLCADYNLERVEKITGVPAEQITNTAKIIYEHGAVSYFAWTGVGQQSNATQTTRAINLLYSLTGCLDSPGGNIYYQKPKINDVSGLELLSKKQREKTLGLAERPLGPAENAWVIGRDLYEAILNEIPYAIKGMLGFGQNLLLTQPDAILGKKALEKLDFYAHADLFLNQTAMYADVVLPVASLWEREGLCAGFQINQNAESLIQLRQKAIAPQGESRSDTWIVFELAKRLGLSDKFFGADIEEGMKYILASSGVTLAELRNKPEGIELPLETTYRKYEKNGFKTFTKRLEIYSQKLLEINQQPLPKFFVPTMSHESRPDLQADFPLVLTSIKIPQYCHSQHRTILKLNKSMPEPLVYLHPDTAKERGISQSDWILVTSPTGNMKAKAIFDKNLLPNVVCSQFGWWGENDGNFNYSNLIDMKECDPISGSASLRAYICNIGLAT